MITNTQAFLFIIFCISLLIQCTPKTTEVTSTTVVQPDPEPVDENLSPCPKFKDNRNSDDLESNYVIYRDFLKLSKYEESFDMWKSVYEQAPAADGKRWTVYSDGIRFYQHFLQTEEDPTIRKQYIENILRLYDEIGECYPEQKTYVKARKAFDFYYSYPDQASNDEKYKLFKEVTDEKQMETYVFVLNPFTKLMVDKFINGEIDTAEAQRYAGLVPEIIQHGLLEGEDLKSWATVRDYSIPYIERLEAVKGFYDCQYYKDKYLPMFEEEERTCESVTQWYSKLRFGGCDREDVQVSPLLDWLKANDCIETAPSDDPCGNAVSSAYDALRNGAYEEAVRFFEEAIECSTSEKNKGTYNMLISKIYYAHLKNFSKSRSYARKAAALRTDWGEPFLLIGKLYASSGPLCGPGRGFDSQVVTWPAIDKWVYAKSIDPSVAAEANKLINRYRQYMPNREDLHLRNIQIGDSFKVECWIQETTKVRTP